MPSLTFISDTHGLHKSIKFEQDGDILVHSGDFTQHGNLYEINEFNAWLVDQPFKHKILIAGNHDFYMENPGAERLITNAIYLKDSSCTILGYKFWGSPWQPWFFDWAFNLKRGEPIKKRWDLIPLDTDILVTHGPPFGHLDKTVRGQEVGCEELVKVIKIVKPLIHAFGHIHEARGKQRYYFNDDESCLFINASILDEKYNPIFKPITEYLPDRV